MRRSPWLLLNHKLPWPHPSKFVCFSTAPQPIAKRPLSCPDSFQRSPSTLDPFPFSFFALDVKMQPPLPLSGSSYLSPLLLYRASKVSNRPLNRILGLFFNFVLSFERLSRIKNFIRSLINFFLSKKCSFPIYFLDFLLKRTRH